MAMDKNKKHIEITKILHKKLIVAKAEGEHKSMDALITHLIDNQK